MLDSAPSPRLATSVSTSESCPHGRTTSARRTWILARFKEWGWDAQVETYDVLFPTPKERIVEMVEPSRFRLTLEEPPVAVDPTSSQKSEQLPSFNAYSIDGDVTGPLVYVNYGRPVDYEELDRHGIDVVIDDSWRRLPCVICTRT